MDKNLIADNGHGKEESRANTHTKGKRTQPCTGEEKGRGKEGEREGGRGREGGRAGVGEGERERRMCTNNKDSTIALANIFNTHVILYTAASSSPK